MVFSSPLFLFAFLPLVLAVYFAAPRVLRNSVLLAASLLFYAWGEPAFAVVMLTSIALNYLAGLAIDAARGTRWQSHAVFWSVAANLGILGYYKYAGFLLDQLNWGLTNFGLHGIRFHPVLLPLGISFFTFQSISYLVDVHRGETDVQRNPVRLALYIALFPQLIAGPIVRYHDVAGQIAHRTVSVSGFATGARRFIFGLGKKVLIANTVGATADAIFAIPGHELSAAVAWLGLICYTLQIYFDFSGYSDMAIGLGRMFGFEFLENFNHPYIATSVTDFWRRWHISLSSWFRDYLYIPLGGNRQSPVRTFANLLCVFLLCGLWHGASWNFVLWGAFHGTFLILERLGLLHFTRRLGPVRHAYLLLAVMLGWVLFRAETLGAAGAFYTALVSGGANVLHPLDMYSSLGLLLALVAGCITALPFAPWLQARWSSDISLRAAGFARSNEPVVRSGWLAFVRQSAGVAFPLLIFAASVIVLSASTYNPFIYFRF